MWTLLVAPFHGNLSDVIDHEFSHNLVKIAVDPRGESRTDPQTTLTIL